MFKAFVRKVISTALDNIDIHVQYDNGELTVVIEYMDVIVFRKRIKVVR